MCKLNFQSSSEKRTTLIKDWSTTCKFLNKTLREIVGRVNEVNNTTKKWMLFKNPSH